MHFLLNTDDVQPRVETINETAAGAKILREKSTLSKEGTKTDMKREKSNLSAVVVKETTTTDANKDDPKPVLVYNTLQLTSLYLIIQTILIIYDCYVKILLEVNTLMIRHVVDKILPKL